MYHRPDLYTRWALEMRSKAYFHPGQRVGVAVSGGPDSVLLFHFMRALAREVEFTLAAVHFNHHLRGPESDGDEALVRELAKSFQIDYLRGEADVGRVRRERHGNLEAVARELRYRYFFSLVDQGRLDLLATAHTASDQAETVLMRVLRGTGTRGLGGIYPQLDGKVVRPFLGLTRADVMEEIAARKAPYRVDSSNLDVKLRRNRVRTELLPLLAKDYNPRIVHLLNQLANRSRDEESCLEIAARERAGPWRGHRGREERIRIRALMECHPALARRILRQMLEGVRGSSRGVMHTHIESLFSFAVKAQSGKTQMLPGGTEARKEFSWLVVSPTPTEPGAETFSYPVNLPGELAVREIGCSFHFKILAREGPGKAYNLENLVGLDPQKLCGDLVLRNWRPGDRFRPIGSRGLRKLKEYFSERKIPKLRRKGWPVLLFAGQIVWVRGFPPGRDFAAGDQAQQVLIVEEHPLRPVATAWEKAI